jgi:hypothetical protein
MVATFVRPIVVKAKLPTLVGRTNCQHGSSYNQDEEALCKSETTHIFCRRSSNLRKREIIEKKIVKSDVGIERMS